MARISKIKFGHKIKNSHLVTVVIIRQRPRKPEVKQPSCWSLDQIKAYDIIFFSAVPARGHCGGVVFICTGVKPCSGYGRIFSVASPIKKTSNNCSFKKDYESTIEKLKLQVSVSALTSLTRYCNGGEHCCHVHGGNLCSEGEVGFLKNPRKASFILPPCCF